MMPLDLQVELERLRNLAGNDDWSLREEAGFAIRDLAELNFTRVMDFTDGWQFDANERVRRAMCLACMQRKRWTGVDRLPRILDRLDPLMADGSLYVRKCCGPFVVGYLGYTYPEIVLPWLKEQSMDENMDRRANVAKSFSQALGRLHPEPAVRILERLSTDPRYRVRAAVAAAVRNVAKTETGTKMLMESECFQEIYKSGKSV